MSYNTVVVLKTNTVSKRGQAAASYLQRLRKLSRELDCTKIAELIEDLEKIKESGNSLFIAGNGGSSATASHWACDLTKTVNYHSLPGKGIKAMSLSDNTPLLTAIANDIGYDQVFAYQIEQSGRPGDILLIISVSGKSENILRAVNTAKKRGLLTWGIIGRCGNKIVEMLDKYIEIPECEYGPVEDFQMILDHLVVACLKSQS